VSKKLFKADLKISSLNSVEKSVQKVKRTLRKNQKDLKGNHLSYYPSRLSPVDFLLFKLLHGQFGRKPFPVLPVAVGMARRTFAQAKRLLSHGSL
jgi:hypothetical protein